MRASALALLLLVTVSGVTGQVTKENAQPPARRASLVIMLGVGVPRSHDPLMQYWGGGPAGSLYFLFGLNRTVSVGLGLDALLMPFQEQAFIDANPGVTSQPRNTGLINFSVITRATLFPGYRFTPFVLASVGAGRVSGASYKEMVNDVRVVYYSIPGLMRLSFGVGGGAYYYVVRGVAAEIEAKGIYLHHDPDAGTMVFLRAGLRLTL